MSNATQHTYGDDTGNGDKEEGGAEDGTRESALKGNAAGQASQSSAKQTYSRYTVASRHAPATTTKDTANSAMKEGVLQESVGPFGNGGQKRHCTSGGTRTRNLLIRSQMRYPIALQGQL